MMVSLEAEAIRTRLKQSIDATLPLQAPRARRRVEYEAALGRSGQLPAGVQVTSVALGPLPAEWVSAPAAAADQVMLYLHGGGYAMGSCASHRLLARGMKPEHVVLAGDSAGGGLALATLVVLRDTGASLPAKAVLLSPWTDLALSGASLVTRAETDFVLTRDYLREEAHAYVGAQDPRTPLASPLYADLHGLPPLLIQVGGDEILLDDATRVAERARQAGVAVTLRIAEGMWHGWQATAALRRFLEGQAALDQIADFVRLP